MPVAPEPEYACLFLPFPPTVNNLFVNNPRTRGRFPSRLYKAWREETARALEKQRPLPSFAGPVRVTYSFGRPDRRRRDLANYEKAASDALVTAGVLADDCQIEHLTLRWDADVVGCRAEIEPLAK